MVKHGDEPQVKLLVPPHGLLCATQQSQQTLPVLKGIIHVSNDETHKGKLQLT